MSRFLAICAIVVSTPFCPAAELPVSGKVVKGFEPVDRAAEEFLNRIDGQAMTVAISRNGVILYSRGFGWRDEARKTQTQPETIMRIASVTKPFTAAAIKTLVRSGKLQLNAKAFDLLKLTPPPGAKVDPRLKSITIQQLLEHKGGWDREKSFDPMFKIGEVEKDLKLKEPAKPIDVVRWMLGHPLQFDPGERRAYSNFGFCVLGRVIEKVSGKSYGDYVKETVLKTSTIKDMKLGRNLVKDHDPKEVWYPAKNINVEVMDSHGGWIASASSLCLFMQHYWIDGDPRGGGTAEWTFFGSLPGTTSMVRQRKDGYNIAVLCNQRREGKSDDDNEKLEKLMDAAVDKAKAGGKK